MIEVNKLSKTYDKHTRLSNTVLHDVTFTLPDKGFVCILGPSGCGKTSLLNALGGLDTFEGGSLTVDDLTVTRYGTRAFELARDRNFGYIFQNYYLLPDHSAAYNVYLGLHSLGLSHKEKIRRVRESLRAVDMERFLRRNVAELSGGQQQRVAIARALARRPRVIFADEPTGNLDEDNTRAVCTLLRKASRNSLVVMVTHEENIARFFADRIITLSDGRLVSDSTQWECGDISAVSGNTIYTGGLEERNTTQGSVTLRLFEEPGAAPAEVTVVVLRDRIVLKLSDSRAASLTKVEESPAIVEGEMPKLKLEEIDREANQDTAETSSRKEDKQVPPGKGITLPMMFREAARLRLGGKMRRAGISVFLVLLTVLILLSIGDITYLAHIDPEDFITSDYHMLLISIGQGATPSNVEKNKLGDFAVALDAAGREAGYDYDLIPPITAKCTFTFPLLYQMEDVSVFLPTAMCWAPDYRLDSAALLYGRMPQSNDEVVMDRQILENLLAQDSMVLASIRDISYFLDKQLEIDRRDYPLTICGICDSGARTAYLSRSAMLALTNSGIKVMSLDELKTNYPAYSDMDLEPGQCIMNPVTAGPTWENSTGREYSPGGLGQYTVVDTVQIDDPHIAVILRDEDIEARYTALLRDNYQVYCTDKATMLPFIRNFIKNYGDTSIQVTVSDRWGMQYQAYEEAAGVRVDARSILTASVLVLCLVMLYLLCRTKTRERLGLVSVYRLLGIPGRKLSAIFLIEGILSSLITVIPTAAITWVAVEVIHLWPGIELPILLPWYAAALAALAIVCYYLLVTVLPLFSLLRLPPARLAARYE